MVDSRLNQVLKTKNTKTQYWNILFNVLIIVAHNTGNRRKRSGEVPALINSAVSLQVYKCYYENCITPVDPSKEPPVDE